MGIVLAFPSILGKTANAGCAIGRSAITGSTGRKALNALTLRLVSRKSISDLAGSTKSASDAG
jgi:hypothetical protein